MALILFDVLAGLDGSAIRYGMLHGRPNDRKRIQSDRQYGRVEIVREKKRHPKMPFNLLSAIYTPYNLYALNGPACSAAGATT